MTDLLSDVLWTEKYRPLELEGLALTEENRTLLSGYLEGGEIPHLLLAGPPGVGKTTVARIITKSLDCNVLTLNASSERGIDVIRDKVKGFVTRVAGIAGAARWNLVFLDEADAMTPDAQTALRNLIETYAEVSRFILTCNYLHRIIGPIQSRCLQISLGHPPLKERFRILNGILDGEGIEATPQVTLSYAERFPDLRKMLMNAQRAYRSHGHLPPAIEEGQTTGASLLELVTGKNWSAIRRVTTDGTFDPQQGLRDLFWAVGDDHPQVGFLRHVIGKAVHESGFSPDPIIHFLGTCAEAMEGLS
jgi:replication factor C small subunit